MSDRKIPPPQHHLQNTDANQWWMMQQHMAYQQYLYSQNMGMMGQPGYNMPPQQQFYHHPNPPYAPIYQPPQAYSHPQQSNRNKYQTSYNFHQASPIKNKQPRDNGFKQQRKPKTTTESTPKAQPVSQEKSMSQQNSEQSESGVKLKKDSKLDSPEQIRKWIEARKRNYPTRARVLQKQNKQCLRQETGELSKNELSQLELRLRKQIRLSSCSNKQIESKWRNMEIIKNILTQPPRRTKPIKKHRESRQRPSREQKGVQEKTNMDQQAEQRQIVRNEDANEERIKTLIGTLKSKKVEEDQAVQCIFNYSQNSSNFKYAKNTLVANLLLEDVFKQNCYLLQAIRYIVKNEFLQNQQDIPLQSPTKNTKQLQVIEQGQAYSSQQEEGQIVSNHQ